MEAFAFHTGINNITVSQNAAAHEFGHLLGLGDEYRDETPPQDAAATFEGDRPRHYQDVEAAMGSALANELLIQDGGSTLSQGGEVRRGHCVNFLNWLSAMTHKAWVIEKPSSHDRARQRPPE
jgi:hypothetical protein